MPAIPAVVASSSLMQSYRHQTPASGDTQVAILPGGGSGGEDAIVSIASNGHLLVIQPDATSETGWSQLDLTTAPGALGFAGAVKQIDTASDAQGRPILAAVVKSDDETSDSLYYINDFSATPEFARWIFLGRSTSTAIRLVRVGLNAAGAPMVAIVTENQGQADAAPSLSVVPAIAASVPPPWVSVGTAAAPVKYLDTTFDNKGRLLVSYVGTDKAARLDAVNLAEGTAVTLFTGPDPYNLLAVAAGPNGSPNLFFASGEVLYYVDPNLGPTRAGILPAPADILVVAPNPQSTFDIYARTTAATVYHAVQGRQDPVEILRGIAHFTAADSGSQTETLVVVGLDDTLRQLVRDPGEDWVEGPIDLGTSPVVEAYTSYSTCLTLYDAAGAVLLYEPVRLTASSVMPVRINGNTFVVGPDDPVEVTTNAAGQLEITSPTSALATATFAVAGDFVDAGHSIEVQPNSAVQQTLAGISGADLLAAKKANGAKLLSTDFQSGDVPDVLAKALNQTMSLGKSQPPDHTAQSRAFARMASPTGLSYRTTPPTRLGGLHAAGVAEQHWEVDFTGASPVFRQHTAASAGLLLAASPHPPTLRALAAASSSDSGFSWGDLWEAIKNGVIDFGKIIVSTIVDPVTKFVQDVVVKIEDFVGNVLWKGALDLVEQVFDVAEGLFIQVKVFFEDLFEWLGFLFDWPDITRTKDAMKAAFIQGMKFVPAALEEFKRRAIDGIEAVQRSVDATFETFISQVVGQQQGLTSYDQAHVTPNADIQQTGVLNIANTGFMNNVGGARRVADSPLPHAAMRAAVDGPIDRLMQEFQQYADRFQSAAAFDQALTYFTQIKEQPDRILQLALAGMLEVAKGIVEFALDVAKTIIGLMVDAINAAIAALVDLLTAPWEVPFLSDLYRNYVSGGSDLSILDVCALIHAIPATVIYKLKFKKSPVPDQDAVAAFAAEFAPTRLLRESGIQGTATPEPRGEAPEAAAPQAAATSQALEPVAAGSDRTAWYYLSNAFYSINMFVYAGFEAILDVIPPDPIPGGNYDLTKLNKRFRDIYYENTSSKLDTFSLATLGMEWTAQLFSIPWVAGDGGAVGCTDDTRFGNFVWIYQFIGTGYDTVWYAVTKAAKGDGVLARNGGDVGVIVDTAYGCSHLLLQFTWAGLNHFQDGPGVAQNLLGTLPEFLKFLRHTKVIAASEGWSLVGLVAADIIGDFAACFLNFKSFFR